MGFFRSTPPKQQQEQASVVVASAPTEDEEMRNKRPASSSTRRFGSQMPTTTSNITRTTVSPHKKVRVRLNQSVSNTPNKSMNSVDGSFQTIDTENTGSNENDEYPAVSVFFEPGPVGLQLEPMKDEMTNEENGCRVVRFVDGGPKNPGQARKSGSIQPGHLVEYAELLGSDGKGVVKATTYDGIISVLKTSNAPRQLVVRPASWIPSKKGVSKTKKSSRRTVFQEEKKEEESSTTRHSMGTPSVDLDTAKPNLQIEAGTAKPDQELIDMSLIHSPSEMVLLSQYFPTASKKALGQNQAAAERTVESGPVIVPMPATSQVDQSPIGKSGNSTSEKLSSPPRVLSALPEQKDDTIEPSQTPTVDTELLANNTSKTPNVGTPDNITPMSNDFGQSLQLFDCPGTSFISHSRYMSTARRPTPSRLQEGSKMMDLSAVSPLTALHPSATPNRGTTIMGTMSPGKDSEFDGLIPRSPHGTVQSPLADCSFASQSSAISTSSSFSPSNVKKLAAKQQQNHYPEQQDPSKPRVLSRVFSTIGPVAASSAYKVGSTTFAVGSTVATKIAPAVAVGSFKIGAKVSKKVGEVIVGNSSDDYQKVNALKMQLMQELHQAKQALDIQDEEMHKLEDSRNYFQGRCELLQQHYEDKLLELTTQMQQQEQAFKTISSTMNNALRDQEAQNRTLVSRVNEVVSQNEDLQSKLVDGVSSMNQKKSREVGSEERAQVLEEQLARTTRDHKATQAELANSLVELSQVKRKLEETELGAQEKSQKLAESFRELEMSKALLKEAEAVKFDMKKQLQSYDTMLQSERSEKEAAQRELSESLVRSKDEVEAYQSRLQAQEQATRDYKAQCDQTIRDLMAQSQDIESKSFQKVNEAQRVSESQLEQLRLSSDIAEREVSRLKAELDASEQSKQQLHTEVTCNQKKCQESLAKSKVDLSRAVAEAELLRSKSMKIDAVDMEKDSTIKSLRTEISEKSKALRTSERDLASKTAEVERLQVSLEETSRSLQDQKNRFEASQSSLSELQSTLADREQRITELQVLLDKNSETMSDLEHKIKKLSQHKPIDDLSMEMLATLQEQVSIYEDESRSLKLELEQSQKAHQAFAEKKTQQIQESSKALQLENKRLKEDVLELEGKLIEMDNHLEFVEKQLDKSEQEHSQAMIDLKQKRDAEIETLKKEKVQVEAALQETIQSLGRSREEHSKSCDELRLVHQREVQRLQQEKSILDKKLQCATVDLDELRNSQGTNSEFLAVEKEKTTVILEEKQRIEAKLRQAEEAFSTLRAELDSANCQVETLQQENNEVKTKLYSAVEAMEDLQSRRIKDEESLVHEKEKNDILIRTKQETEDALREAEETIGQLRTEMDIIQQEVDESSSDDSTGSELRDLSKRDLREECVYLQEELIETEARVLESNMEVDRQKRRISVLERNNSSISEELQLLLQTNRSLETMIIDLKKGKNSTLQELQSLQEIVNQATAEKDKLRNDIQEKERALEDTHTQICCLEAQISDLSGQSQTEKQGILDTLNSLSAEKKLILQEIDQYKAQIEAFEGEISTLKSEVVRLEAEKEALSDRATSLSIALEEETSAKTDSQKELERLQQSLEATMAKESQFEETQKDEIESLKKLILLLRAECVSKCGKERSQEKEILMMNQSLDVKTRECESLAAALEEKEAELVLVIEKESEIKLRQEFAEEEAKSLKDKIGAYEKEKEMLERDIIEMKDDYSNEMKSLQSNLDLKVRECERLKVALDEKEAESILIADSQKEKLSDLSSERAVVEDEMNKLRLELVALSDAKDSIERELVEQREYSDDISNARANVVSKLSEASRVISQQKETIGSLEQELVEAKGEVSSLSNKLDLVNETTEQTLNLEKAKREEAESKLLVLTKEYDSFKNNMEEKENELSENTNRVSVLEESKSLLENRVHDLEESILRFKKQAASQESAIEEAQISAKHLQSNFEAKALLVEQLQGSVQVLEGEKARLESDRVLNNGSATEELQAVTSQYENQIKCSLTEMDNLMTHVSSALPEIGNSGDLFESKQNALELIGSVASFVEKDLNQLRSGMTTGYISVGSDVVDEIQEHSSKIVNQISRCRADMEEQKRALTNLPSTPTPSNESSSFMQTPAKQIIRSPTNAESCRKTVEKIKGVLRDELLTPFKAFSPRGGEEDMNPSRLRQVVQTLEGQMDSLLEDLEAANISLKEKDISFFQLEQLSVQHESERAALLEKISLLEDTIKRLKAELEKETACRMQAEEELQALRDAPPSNDEELEKQKQTAAALAEQLEMTREKLVILKSRLKNETNQTVPGKGEKRKPKLRKLLSRIDNRVNKRGILHDKENTMDL